MTTHAGTKAAVFGSDCLHEAPYPCARALRHNRTTMSGDDRVSEFEARLAALKHKMESGLIERAHSLRELAARVEAGDAVARKQLKSESHKLRGVAGSYGHQDLTDLASQLEQRASMSPPAAVGQMARELADLAEKKAPAKQAAAGARARELAPVQARLDAAGRATRTRAPRPAPARAGDGRRSDHAPALDAHARASRRLRGEDRQLRGRGARALSTQTFDMVVSDAMMPDMNGRQFSRAARAARRDDADRDPVRGEPGRARLEQHAGSGDSWLRKPFKPTDLVRDLTRIVSKSKR